MLLLQLLSHSKAHKLHSLLERFLSLLNEESLALEERPSSDAHVGSETCRVEISSLSSNALKKCASNTLSLMLGVHKNHVDVSVLIDIGKPDYFIARSGDETISFEHVEVPLSSASLPRLGPSPDLLWRVVSRSDPCDRCRKDLQRDRSVVSLVRADAWVVRSCAHTLPSLSEGKGATQIGCPSAGLCQFGAHRITGATYFTKDSKMCIT